MQEDVARKETCREAVLRLWGAKTHSDTIMELLKIDEETLESILPRSLWLGSHMAPCRHCAGRGYFTQTVPWGRRDPPPPDWDMIQTEVEEQFPKTLAYLGRIALSNQDQ